eukprot:GGOE01014663.1.p1 GENE.GGOE01014663.1~~GGOE01014663.1.p1  ORF type:complete len:524 (-),score=136.27 GGOE01014663.1:98-1669(-)
MGGPTHHIVGVEGVRHQLMVLLRAVLFGKCPVELPRAVLLCGSPGTGKTSLAKEIKKDLQEEGSFGFSSRVPDVVTELPEGPALFLLDDFELSLLGHPTIFLTLQKLLSACDRVAIVAVVQAAENLPEDRCRVFGHTFTVAIPTQHQRHLILEQLLGDVDLVADETSREAEPKLQDPQGIMAILASKTLGFVGKDLLRMCRAAHVHALRQASDPHGRVTVEFAALVDAMKSIKAVPLAGLGDPVTPIEPSAFCGYSNVRQKCIDLISWFASRYEAEQEAAISQRQQLIQCLSSSSGILLYGPSGCGKSHLVRMLAGSTRCNWVSLKGSSIFSKYVGEAERVIRQTFRRAAGVAPCVLVLDEIDALTRSRQLAAEEDGGATRQVLSTLLCEMDGIEGHRGVLVIGCSNRPKLIDAALLRQGRLEHLVYLGPPSHADRLALLQQCCRRQHLADDVDLEAVASRTEGVSCAALTILCREASMASFREAHCISPVRQCHLEAALDFSPLQPLSQDDIQMHYETFAAK